MSRACRLSDKEKISVAVHYRIHREDDLIIASCDSLDVHGQGKTEKEAVNCLYAVLAGFLESCWDDGVFEQVLREAGYQSRSMTHAANDVSHGHHKPSRHAHHLKSLSVSVATALAC